jgi:hypothetical protein
MFKAIRLLVTHGIALATGFILGIYVLPILTAPEAPTVAEVMQASKQAEYKTRFEKDLEGSDFLHWGEGEVSLSKNSISFTGSMAPGPDYQLYLTKELVLTEDAFLAIKSNAVKIGPVKTFDNFILAIPANVNPADYRAVIVWCESFGQFITAASYR